MSEAKNPALNRAVSNLQEKSPPLYSTTPPTIYTSDFYFALLLYPPLLLGLNLLFELACTWGGHGLFPVSQVCICPSNAASFSSSSIYYEGCVDSTSAWYLKHNQGPANATFAQQGWFYSQEWSRETLRAALGSVSSDEAVDATYECPTFLPFWSEPVGYSAIVFLAGSGLLVVYFVASMFVTKTIIYEDRVETHYWGGNIEAVPLSKVVETVKHEMAELPPVKKSALTLKADEIVLYKDGKTVTKVLKGGDGKKVKKKELRVEPDDGEEFRSVLEEAKGRAESNEHFFSKEMEGMNATSDESESGAKTFTPSAFAGRGGYWLRAALMTVAYIVVVDFGSKVVFYLIDDLIQPNRPKDADDFKHKVLEISYFTIFLIGSILYHCFKEALNAVPTSVEVGPRALVVTMSRAAKSELEDSYRRVCIPIDAIASVDTMPAGLEGCITRVFDERRAVYVRPRRYFIVTENKTEKVIEKRVANDQEKGMELAVSEFRYFLLPSGQREEFIALIKARVSGGGGDNEDL